LGPKSPPPESTPPDRPLGLDLGAPDMTLFGTPFARKGPFKSQFLPGALKRGPKKESQNGPPRPAWGSQARGGISESQCFQGVLSLDRHLGPLGEPLRAIFGPFLAHFGTHFGTPFWAILEPKGPKSHFILDGPWPGPSQRGSQNGPKRAIFGPILDPFLAPFEPIWPFWAVYVGLIETFGPLWPGGPKGGPNMAQNGPKWPKMALFGLFWAIFGPIGAPEAKKGHFRPFLAIWAIWGPRGPRTNQIAP